VKNALAEMLRSAGLSAHLWSSPDGSSAVISPFSGRILGLFSPASNENFLWTNPALLWPQKTRELSQSDRWQNLGGDRTWLAPEIEFFFPHYPKTDVYLPPRQMDPGSYELLTADNGISLTNQLSLQMYASHTIVNLTVDKRLTPAVNPLLAICGELSRRLEYAGYTLSTTLSIQGQAPPSPIGLWNLLQLPHSGEMIIPTYSRAVPVVYMGVIASGDLKISDHSVRYRMDAEGDIKIGLHAVFCTGRAAYLYRSGDDLMSLVVRNFVVDPSGVYVDVPATATQTTGCTVQACNVNSSLGAFSELEYHTPGIGGLSGRSKRFDESQVWAFRGPKSDIMEVARLLVSPEL
jgi:hypothetical protein